MSTKALLLMCCLQVVDMFGSLLERPLVAADALSRYPLLVTVFEKELNCCKFIYDKHIQLTEERGKIH